jgi:hypothetical protein
LQTLGNKLSFMTKQPEPLKESVLEWKRLDEITYNDYVSFIQLQQNQMENLHLIIKLFTKNDLFEEQILALSVPEFVTGFFLFRKELKQYLKASIKSTRTKLIKQILKEKTKKVWHSITRK